MKRPLRLTAPWYRWERQGVHPRDSRPVIQKYDRPDMVEAFLRDPQRSLVFTDDDERYRTVAAGAGATRLQVDRCHLDPKRGLGVPQAVNENLDSGLRGARCGLDAVRERRDQSKTAHGLPGTAY